MQVPTARSKGVSFVSVVIPAHNEEIYLLSCLESIKKQDYAGEYEVIVVDNASTDNTAQIARDWGAKVVYEGKRSPACARQKGAEVAISIRGIEVGRDIQKDETLFVSVPESHVRQLNSKFLDELTTDQKEALRDYIKLKRQIEHAWWGI